jgi:hypothetical protein
MRSTPVPIIRMSPSDPATRTRAGRQTRSRTALGEGAQIAECRAQTRACRIRRLHRRVTTAAASGLANLRAAHGGGESLLFARRATSAIVDWSSRPPRCASSCWSSERGTRRVFCIDLGSRERRLAVAPTARGDDSPRCSERTQDSADANHRLTSRTPATGARPNRLTSPGGFPAGRGPGIPTPGQCLTTTGSIRSRPNRRFHRQISRWEGRQMLASTHLEGCQWVRNLCSLIHQGARRNR